MKIVTEVSIYDLPKYIELYPEVKIEALTDSWNVVTYSDEYLYLNESRIYSFNTNGIRVTIDVKPDISIGETVYFEGGSPLPVVKANLIPGKYLIKYFNSLPAKTRIEIMDYHENVTVIGGLFGSDFDYMILSATKIE